VSDLSVTEHNLQTLLAGKSTFSQFAASEASLVKQNIQSLDPAIQGSATIMLNSFEVGASTLVGAGMTAIGPILAESSDAQATQIANLLQLMGVKTVGPFSVAEHAALVTVINGLKAQLDQIGLKITTSGIQTSQ
jgi:hypothetical protein